LHIRFDSGALIISWKADKVASAPPRGVGWILAGDEGGYLQLQANVERKTKEKELGLILTGVVW
jgi:hypothetical protein